MGEWMRVFMIERIISLGKKILPSGVQATLKQRTHFFWQPYVGESPGVRLHLGCGNVNFSGYMNIDLPPSDHVVGSGSGAEIYADVRYLPFHNGSVAEIQAHHIFEHFSRVAALKLLIHWYELLESGGSIVIATPNLPKAAKRANSRKASLDERMAALRHIFGSQEADWAYHLDGWARWKWELILPKLGFGSLRFREYSTNKMDHIVVKATKLNEIRTREELVQNSIALIKLSAPSPDHPLAIAWVEKFMNE